MTKTYRCDNGGWVVADKYWLPGVYASQKAAKMAAKLPDDVLYELTMKICALSGLRITSDDLEAAKAAAKGRKE